ncbi:MAG: hypothetical protein A3F13_00220 [Gammaproteobacteria bacterium RIFCSPHIGHO2_12_FULL_40_19]|nr:MAG: hypothetical protein A3F13_00220 [Gammaproteobacteria bacterium RIFCSPHIGHO2_12_FULL_40_19]
MVQWQTQLEQLRKDDRVPIVLTVLFALLLLLAIWESISTITQHHQKITALKTMAPTVPLQNLANLHLFGVYASNLENLPTTQLQFTLEGTIVFLDVPTESRALIASPNTPAKVYKVGDILPGNATITRIAKHYVVVDDNGILEKLVLPIHALQSEK